MWLFNLWDLQTPITPVGFILPCGYVSLTLSLFLSLQVTKEDIKQEVQKVTEGVVDVIVYPSAADKTKNRGYVWGYYLRKP